MNSESNRQRDTRGANISLWFSIPLYLGTSILLVGIINVLFSMIRTYSNWFFIAYHFFSALAVTATAFFFLKYINKVPTKELGLSIRSRGKDCVLGLVWALALYAAAFSLSLWMGAIEVVDTRLNASVLLSSFAVFFFASVTEEVIFRGYIQGRLMTRMNKFLALAVASLFFAAIHLFNPNIGLLPFINLFLAGVMLGASYLYTRNLWFPIMLHLAWNWFQGPVLGYEVSGLKLFPSAIVLSLPEKNLLNGGDFGFEGSIICTVLLVLSSAVIIMWGEKKFKNV